MPVNIVTSIEIACPRAEVSVFAADPDNATAWYSNIKSVEWQTAPPLAEGSEIAFVANFLGRRIAYTYRVVELVVGQRFVMSTEQGPFPMRTEYSWVDAASGTLMTLRNSGQPSGFGAIAAPALAAAMRRANNKDLLRLKAILESHHRDGARPHPVS
ncbi:SRPBCC family protein [Jatrophihabitans telluris]|uniref:SRPBCC family protein n=1 Tax=Jatrophihabitans telluris TaxID=2038343 RepID=A0ABY4R255_9ACTN|nr:SRPBCC family protein [Jatrophihabitans telluris]UQX89220.1 SRPBCC family protein [Jatrophihabitans telluris]